MTSASIACPLGGEREREQPASQHHQHPAAHQHYLAIGAMMNPVSVKNRKLNLEINHPAQPGVLVDHKLCFFGSQGFAEVIYEKGSSLHGVVYQNVPALQMAELDLIERDYVRKYVNVQLYPAKRTYSKNNDDDNNGSSSCATTIATTTLQNVSVYCRPQGDIDGSRDVDRPPGERYLQVLIDGARHYGVDPQHIRFLERHESRPRPNPCEFMTFSVAEGAQGKTMKRSFVHTVGNGQNGNPLYVTSNGKVIELCKEGDEDPFFKEQMKLFNQYERDIELFMSRVQYDPKYGIPSCIEEVSPEWSAYTEHHFCEYMNGNNLLHKWKVVASLDDC